MATKASEELLAAPLPELIQGLGEAVATANAQLAANPANESVFTVESAEVELKVAISIDKQTDAGVQGGATLSAFSVNASYSSTYGFKEEASSTIKLTLACKPRTA